MADNGPASGSPELSLQTGTTSGVFLEVHTQGPVTTAASSGVPGGLSGPASGLTSLGPADYPTACVTAYGTVSAGTAVAPIFNLGGTGALGPANPVGAGNLNLFRTKNPA